MKFTIEFENWKRLDDDACIDFVSDTIRTLKGCDIRNQKEPLYFTNGKGIEMYLTIK